MFKSCLFVCAVLATIACCSAAPKPLVVPAAYTVPAASAHIVPGSPFVTGYSAQQTYHVARSGALVAAPALAYSSPYVAAPAYYL